jgi:hypothetical protein
VIVDAVGRVMECRGDGRLIDGPLKLTLQSPASDRMPRQVFWQSAVEGGEVDVLVRST